MANYDPSLALLKPKLLRVGVRLSKCADCTEYSLPSSQVDNVDQLIALSKRTGTRIIIAVSVVTPHSTQDQYWFRPRLRDSIVTAWRSLATRYRDEPMVAAYDILNEPYPPGDAKVPDHWIEFASRIVSEIRSIDQNHVIVVQGTPQANPFYFQFMKPLPYPNLVYSVHMYDPFEVTHQGTDERFPQGVSYPGTIGDVTWDKARLSATLQHVRNFSRRNNVPIMVGEFGCVRWAPDGSATRYLSDLMEIFNAEGWAWTIHAYREWHGWDAEIPSEDPTNTQRKAQAPTFNAIKEGFIR